MPLAKLYGREYPRPVNLDEPINEVFQCIKNTIIQKRGHQVILLGARATGKSLVVHEALQMIEKDYSDQFLLVKINGMLQHEDRLALREIAKQLDAQINGAQMIEKPSMNETLKGLNLLFERATSSSKSVVFIVDELDRFAINHQVLAYELFDWCQSCLAGVAIVGLSTRMNIIDLFEKRNRSRNTAKVIPLSKPRSVEELIEIGQELVSPLEIDFQTEAEEVYYTSNSVRHLMSLLQTKVLQQDVSEQYSSEQTLQPLESIPQLDLALLICAARALSRFSTTAVNLVIVLNEWRALATVSQNSKFQMTGKSVPKPGSTPASLRAAKYAWERLHESGLLAPNGGGSEDLKMYVPELDLEDIRGILPRSHILFEWTNL